MRILTKKNIIAFVAAIALFAVTFSVLSFTFADEENGSNESDGLKSATITEGKSIIDYIIDFSNSTDSEIDPVYHIYEIHSGDVSSFQNLVRDGYSTESDGTNKTKFEKLVLDGNKSNPSASPYFKAGNIEFLENSLNDDPEIMIERISNADLIYISEDPDNMFSASNDILSEEVKDALARYATNDNKPIIFDSHTITTNTKGKTNNYKSLIQNYFVTEGASYNSISWNKDISADQFLNVSNAGSKHIPQYGDKTDTWIEVTKPSGTEYIARVLTINADGGTASLTNNIKTGLTAAYAVDDASSIKDPRDETVDLSSFDNSNTYVLGSTTPVSLYGYFGNSLRPNAVKFDSVSASADLTSIDFSKYDFILIEGSCANVSFAGDSSSSLLSAMYSNSYIFYDSTLGGSSSSSGTVEWGAVNLKYVYDKVADDNDKPRYPFVLVCSRQIMDIYNSAYTAKGVKDIADIINAGSFRGITSSGGGDSSSVYTVLEIEPCYPINDKLAAALGPARAYTNSSSPTNKSFEATSNRGKMENAQFKKHGFYYLRTGSVSSNTPDEIQFGDGLPLSSILDGTSGTTLSSYIKPENMDNVTDYYAWSVSKAKIAHATGRSYNKINVVHMSSLEFNTSRKSLLDNYDAIFIGGNNTAFKDIDDWNSKSLGNAYNMYFRNGDTYNFPNTSDKVGNYGILSGNDITESKYKELQEYATKMPLIIDKKLSDAYKDVLSSESGGPKQTYLDPESNVRRLMDDISVIDINNNLDSKYDTTLVNFDFDYVNKTNNSDNKYGKTYGGYATVFKGIDTVDYRGIPIQFDDTKTVDEKNLSNLLKAHARPLMYITKMPTEYNDTDVTTWIENGPSGVTLKWNVDVTRASTVKLIVDDNANGRFEEAPSDSKSGTSVTLSYPIKAEYYGVVYWKVIAETSDGLSCSTVNVCKIKRNNQKKMTVDLLQIMPSEAESNLEYSESATREKMYSTLYFCTECQTARTILKNNRSVATGKYYSGVLGNQNAMSNFYWDEIDRTGLRAVDSNLINAMKAYDSTYSYTASKLGTHTHTFGIVKYYDTYDFGGLVGCDDLTTNWFNLIKDDYIVNTNIIYAHEFDEMVDRVNNYYQGKDSATIKKLVESTTSKDGVAGFNEKANTYEKNYSAMQKLINGEYNTVTGSPGSYSVTVNVNKFIAENPELYGILEAQGLGSNVEKYAKSSYELDNFLINNRSSIEKSPKLKGKSSDMQSEIDFETDSSIDRDKRNYHDMFSMFGDLGDVGFSITDFASLYADYRDAKILENFFWDHYQQNKIYAGVDYKTGKIDLDKIYTCIVLGAAEKFSEDDLEDYSCDALASYINKDGNLILMHDALTSDAGATDMMTAKLSSLFGMNARHKSKLMDKQAVSKTADITVDSITKSVDLGSDILSKDISLTQKTSKIEESDYPIIIKIGDLEEKVTAYDNSDPGYDITIEKSYEGVPMMELGVYRYQNWDGKAGAKLAEMTFDASSSTVTGDLLLRYGGTYNGVILSNLNTSGSTSGTHNISVKLNFKTFNNSEADASEIDYTAGDVCIVLNGDTSHPIRINDNTSFNVSSDDASSSSSKEVYKVTNWSKKSGSPIGENSIQTLDINVVEGTAPVVGETINYTINGVSGSITTGPSGDAVIYRENYKVDDYILEEIDSKNVSSADPFTDEQTLQITVYGPDGTTELPGKAVNVKAGSNPLDTVYTDASGISKFIYSNYIEQDPATPTETMDPGYEAKEDTYRISNISNNLSITSRMLSHKGYFMTVDEGNWGQKQNYPMYKFSNLLSKMEEAGVGGYMMGTKDMRKEIADSQLTMACDRAQKNNEGVITLYPFGIGDTMKVSATLPGSYSVDVEDEDVVVYYSLVGGSSGTSSSFFAADPMDGANNYFLYQKGSITYTGAGHSLITGYGRNNNDERKLFINIIVNSAKKSSSGPTLTLHDLDSNGKTNVDVVPISADDCNYYTSIESVDDFKGFDMLPIIQSDSKLKHVKIFYDINHTENKNDEENGGIYTLDSGDVLIFEADRYEAKTTSDSVLENVAKAIKSETRPSMAEDGTGMQSIKAKDDKGNETSEAAIKLKEGYFDTGVNKKYAYIVVQITDSNGVEESKVLRIQYKPELQDLN